MTDFRRRGEGRTRSVWWVSTTAGTTSIPPYTSSGCSSRNIGSTTDRGFGDVSRGSPGGQVGVSGGVRLPVQYDGISDPGPVGDGLRLSGGRCTAVPVKDDGTWGVRVPVGSRGEDSGV